MELQPYAASRSQALARIYYQHGRPSELNMQSARAGGAEGAAPAPRTCTSAAWSTSSTASTGWGATRRNALWDQLPYELRVWLPLLDMSTIACVEFPQQHAQQLLLAQIG